ncbi:ThiF family adenylyltransferase [Luteimicrobium subarcticum]|uniref:ThiF family protein n=1 Tax=Luteimicrobium subarcticum TaxID=620910 RepID=A0A2M8WUZ2_9MICO|nr:ThiF family adenylyltransferase [Luteimicrobium subarcticum]PJI94743.1 ThiF family protein [Luteimicrobium subarcticum]
MSARPSTRPPDVPPTPDRDGTPVAHPAGALLTGPLARAHLRPGIEVLWRGTGELQLGSDPRSAVRVDGLAPAETRWLGAAGSRPLAATARRHGVTPDRALELLEVLHRAGAVVDPPPVADDPEITAPGGGGGDLAALSSVDADGWGSRVLRRRAARTVAVLGLGRTGAGIAAGLASAGVGRLVLGDARPVQATDVGATGHRLRDVGVARQDAVAETVAQLSPATHVRTSSAERLRQADVVVLVEHRAADTARAGRLVGADVAHLSVVLHEAGVTVGPFVDPGRTPCLRCVDLHRRDDDPRWPTMAVQLRQGTSGAEESATASVGAGLATAQVLARLDGLPVRTAGASLEVLWPDAVPRIRQWQPHASCGCHCVP